MKRTPFARCDKPSTTTMLTIKPKTCKAKGCTERFIPRSMGHVGCSINCAALIARAKREQAETKARQESRAKDRKAREEMKTLPKLKAEAQKEFNAYIRARDRLAGHGCICCGAALSFGGVGGGVDAGHYRSVGSAPHLRYCEENCHSQTVRCNRFGAGRAVDYRAGLLVRIGLARVEALEADQTPRHYTRDDLRAIRDEYRARVRQMEKKWNT